MKKNNQGNILQRLVVKLFDMYQDFSVESDVLYDSKNF